MEPILTIDNLNSFGGNMLRQGDKSQLKYRLRDVGNKNLAISSKPCQVRMYGRNYTTVVYETSTTVSSDNTVTFTIDKVLPKGTFYLEFTVGDYIFPTDHKEFFEITPSGKGIESNIIEIIGVDQIVNKVLGQVDADIGQAVTDITTTNEAIQQAETQRVLAESERNEKFEGYSETFSNMSNVIEGAEGSMENLISNGDFSKDSNGDGLADGLVVSSGVTHSLVNGTQSFTPTEAYDALINLNFAGDGVSKYYISALVKSNKNTTQMRIASPTAIIKPHSGSGQYERLSVIGVASSTRIMELGTSSFSKIDVRNWVAINLDVFDSEPTVAEMDRLMDLHGGYFEGKVPHKLTQRVLVNSLLEQPKSVDSKIQDFKDAIVTQGGNLYDKVKHFIPNKYSNVSGVISNATGWGLAQVPIEPGSEYSIMLPNLNDYTGTIGSVSFYKGAELVSFIYPANEHINGQYNGKDYITVTTPAGADSINITVKSTTFDESDSLIVVEGSSVNERTINKTLVSFYGANVNPLEKLSEYHGVKWTVVGDSLTEINSRSSKFYHQYIADELGFEVTNMGVGGTGYKRKDDTNNAFYQRILNIPTDTEVVTIFGSFNDLGSGVPLGNADDTGTDTLAGAINTTIDRLLDILPLVPLGIISPTPWHTTLPWDENNQGSQYVALLESICRRRGLPYLDLYHTSGLRPWEESYRTLVYNKDPVGNGTHPNEIGHELISKRVREFVKSLI